MDEMNGSKKNRYTIVAIGVTLVLASALLVFVARGKSYDLRVTDPAQGPDNAPVLIEEFADFQCPACRTEVEIIGEAVKQYPTQVKFVHRDFPLPEHEYARITAAAALCAADQNKFWEFHGILFDKQPEWSLKDRAAVDSFLTGTATDLGLNIDTFNTCRKSRQAAGEVDRDFSDGVSRGVNATPTFFLNGSKVDPISIQSVFSWTQLINAELQKKGLTPENQPKP